MCASKGRDLLKGQRGGLVVTTPRHGAGVGSMGRKVEVKEFELSTKLMNSEKLKNMVESSRDCRRRWVLLSLRKFFEQLITMTNDYDKEQGDCGKRK